MKKISYKKAGDVYMKKEKNRKVKKGAGGRKHSWQYRAISLMCVILLVCSTVILDTGLSRANSFDDEISLDTENVDTVENAAETGGTEEYPQEIAQDSSEVNVDFEDDFTDTPAETVQEENLEAAEEAADFSAGDDEETVQPETVTYTKFINNDTVEVKAEAEAGTLPEGAELNVTPVEKETEQYTAVENVLTSLAQNKETKLDGFLTYNVSFTDSEGNPVEPNGTVQYSFQYTEPVSPELADPENTTVTAVKIRKNTETSEMEFIELNAEDHKLAFEMNESRQLQKAEFQSADTATVAFAWNSKETAQAEDNNGENQNQESQPDETPDQNTEQIPEQAPIGTIEITADEVNLRTAPSTEAEVIATANTGTQLPLLETVTAEDGSNWYKVTYDGTIVYVRSDMAAVVGENQEEEITEEATADEEELPTEETDSEEVAAEEAGTLTFTKKINDLVEITATTEAGVIPEDAELMVNTIEEGTDQYSDTETRLNEKAQNDGYEIAGFLAYDIYFQNSDGEKIEPADGTVKVSISYLQATAPESVQNAEQVETTDGNTIVVSADEFQQNDVEDGEVEEQSLDAAGTTATPEVAVMHLVEDETGNVPEVVDMTSQEQATVETTENGAVQKAEFETESFSTFTVTWKVEKKNKNLSIVLKELKEDGKVHDFDTTPSYNKGNINDRGNIDLLSYATVSGYNCVRAYALKDNKEINITKISYNSDEDGWCYLEKGESNWTNTVSEDKNYTVYLVYEKAKPIGTISTVDSRNEGITLNLFNYGGTSSYINDNNAINKNHTLHFNGSCDNSCKSYNKNDNNRITNGLVNSTLSNGYPKLKVGGEESLEYLFSTREADGKKVYDNVNHLFTKDSDGYYVYNSAQNYAWYDNTTKNFVVYDVPAAPAGNSAALNVGNFFPFNKLADNSNIKSGNLRNFETGTDATPKDCYFGMTMAANFVQAKSGKINGKDMVFEFSGDDDVWVFIDDVLVLDIGGIHAAMSGSINFATGAVETSTRADGTSNKTNLKDIFGAANKDTSKFNGNTFGDYTGHTIKFFYLERGAGASNCKLKFNMPTIPAKSVAVEKQLSNTDKEKYANVNFKFKLYAQHIVNTNPTETYNETYDLITSNAKLKLQDGSDGGSLTFADDGTFTLKPGQQAIFSELQENRKYYVEEVGVSSEEYDKVTINETVTTNENGEITSGKETVANRPLIVFTNNCSVANQRELRITKKIKNNVEVTDTFNFKVMLNDANGNLIPYVGPYYLQDSTNNYYRYNDSGKLVNTSGGPCGQTSAEGIISGVPAGYTASITQILSGTKFLVQETDIDANRYVTTPEYNLKKATLISNNTDGISGTIVLYENALVTVTNALKTNLTVNKEWVGDEAETTHGDILVGLYDNTDVPVSEDSWHTLNESNNFTYTFTDVSRDDRVYELRPVIGDEKAEFTINGTGYRKAETGSVITVKAKDVDTKYNVSYGDKVESGNEITQTITNTKITADLKLLKVDTNNHDVKLQNAVFTLYKNGGDDQLGDVVKENITTDANGQATVTGLTPGKYILRETKAPTTYTLAAKDWMIEVKDNKDINITFNGKNVTANDTGEFPIENTKVYSLPSSGGSGTYGFTISGVAILTAALLLFIKNKRKEDEACRSTH